MDVPEGRNTSWLESEEDASINGLYKTNIDCSFIREMLENYCTLGEIQPCLAYYSPRPGGPWWIVGQGWISPRVQ